jgi:hypothetical protein
VFTIEIDDYDYHYLLKDPNTYWAKAKLSDEVMEWFKEGRIFQGMHYQFITGSRPDRQPGRIAELRFSDEETAKTFSDYWSDRYFPIKFTAPSWEATRIVEEWLKENCQHGYLMRSTIVWFRDKTEATLFKLSV